jgi:hypothetical protein
VSRSRGADPFTQLGLQWLEMMSAASFVIARRSRRRNSAAQIFHMGNEKFQAGVEAWHGLLRQSMMPASPDAHPAELWARYVAAGMAPFHARAVRNARRRTR